MLFSKGRLTAITRDGETVAYRYDRFGRVTQDGGLKFLATGRALWRTAATIAGMLLLLNCRAKVEYDFDADQSSAKRASEESVDGTWTAAFGEWLLPLIENHETEYAPGYNEQVFRSLAPGTQKSVVEQRLGKPLLVQSFSDGDTYWYYSRHGRRFKSYFVRILVFNDSGHLVARRGYFYLD